jgi:hypothetical protein
LIQIPILLAKGGGLVYSFFVFIDQSKTTRITSVGLNSSLLFGSFPFLRQSLDTNSPERHFPIHHYETVKVLTVDSEKSAATNIVGSVNLESQPLRALFAETESICIS